MKRLFRILPVALIIVLLLTFVVPATPTYAATKILRPNANGYANQFEVQVPDSGEHWDKVDEVTQDGVTTVLQTSTINLVELFNLSACGLSNVIINSVKVYTYSMQYNESSNKFRIMIRSGTTEAFGALIDQTSWRLNSETWNTDPATGLAWTISAIDALQAGMKTYSTNGGRQLTQVYVEIDYTQITAPTITTSAATNIAATTATLNGNVTATGGESCNVTVYWGDNDGGQTPGSWDYNSVPTSPGQPQSVAAFYKNVTGLSAVTTWYFSAKATNSAGTGWGTTQSFLTLGVPTVTTSAATSVEETTATLSGNVTVINDTSIVSRGFYYDTNSGVPYANTINATGTFGVGAFSQAISSLTKGELYYFIATVENSLNITANGSELTFLTKPDEPSAFSATATASGTISLSWTKGAGAQNTYVVRKVGSYPTSRTDGTLVYNNTGTSYNDTGLTGGLLYYYRAWSYATEGGKEQYSDLYVEGYALAIAFPTVTTNSATSVSETTATLNANITNTGGEADDYRGFVWDTTSRADPGNTAPGSSAYANNWTESGSFSTGTFSHPVTGLLGTTPYYVRGCAHNSMGWSYGNEVSFTTIVTGLVLWFQPDTVISGTTLVDRAMSNDGIITWGTNPSGITVWIGAMDITGAYTNPTEETVPEMWTPPPEAGASMEPGSAAAEEIASGLPFYDGIFKPAAVAMGMPVSVMYMIAIIAMSIGIGFLFYVLTGSEIVGIGTVAAGIGGGVNTGLIPLWWLIVYLIASLSLIYVSKRA